ncbi:MAG: S-methyl-5'-thioadenosine phosphorylase [Chloroflexi bacterium]|nr:S-methyl-5'-thioadenosine phosphorylase [Chloroflexota bacterium]OJV97556.1 MAG: methylthioadenosine phosphorylase [Chloroflexi bacterium 54-19]
MPEALVGVIGGSGLYQIEGLTEVEEFFPDTPWGKPSDALMVGKLDGVSVAFLPRHGRGHRISPTDLPVQANIYAFKMLGVKYILSVSAVGSMKEEIPPLDLVVPDQIFDRTVARPRTYFGDHSEIVGHIPFAEPFCQSLRPILKEVSEASGANTHYGGTYICIEGPQFSTRGESLIYRQWGVDVIGMTAIPEAKLAREAEIHYVLLACATDYDCWHDSHESVTVEMVVENLQKNVGRAKEIIRRFVPLAAALPEDHLECGCDKALSTAIMTDRTRVPAESVQKLGLLVQKYF